MSNPTHDNAPDPRSIDESLISLDRQRRLLDRRLATGARLLAALDEESRSFESLRSDLREFLDLCREAEDARSRQFETMLKDLRSTLEAIAPGPGDERRPGPAPAKESEAMRSGSVEPRTRAIAFVEAVNSHRESAARDFLLAHFTSGALEAVSLETRMRSFASLRDRLGRVDVDTIETSEEGDLALVLRSRRDGARHHCAVHFDPDPPFGIRSIRIDALDPIDAGTPDRDEK